MVFEVKTGGWRYKDNLEKLEFFSRTGAVAYAVAKHIGKNSNNFINLDREVEKHLEMLYFTSIFKNCP